MAMTTARWVEFSGVITLSGRDSRRIAPDVQARTQRPQPRHNSASSFAFSCLGRWGIVRRNQAHRLDGADLYALPATGASLFPDDGEEMGRVYGVEDPETTGGDQRLAAAAAAVADEIDPFPDVFSELDEPLIMSPGQEIQPLGRVNGAGEAVADQGVGGVVERHADLHRRAAGPTDVFHLVAAVADADRPVGGGADHVARPLVVEDVKGVFSGKARFMDEDPSELSLPVGEEGLDERLLDVEILIIEFA